MLKITKDPLFKPHASNILIPAITVPFIGAEHFKKDLSATASVKISYIGDNFTELFLGQAVPMRDAYAVCSTILTRNARDKEILGELSSAAETDIAALFHLMSLQPKGEDGHLLTNGYVNIFYCKDMNEALCAVRAVWDGDGWDVGVGRVGHPYPWVGGRQVFSRNS